MMENREGKLFEVLSVADQFDAPQEVLRTGGPVVGKLEGLSASGMVLVEFDANHSGNLVPAQSVVEICDTDIGKKAVILFEKGDRLKPIVMGILQKTSEPSIVPEISTRPTEQTVETFIDGERLILRGRRQIVLQCGEASITLTRAGKVLIRGTHLLSRSSGINKIKGGCVQIN